MILTSTDLRAAFLAGYERGQSWEDPDHDPNIDFEKWVSTL